MTKYEIEKQLAKMELWLELSMGLKKESVARKYRIEIEELKNKLKVCYNGNIIL
tara:strand:+ start:2842 stop:3003 length:162 start_codon:yes stop_codon:yes gene_type:complete